MHRLPFAVLALQRAAEDVLGGALEVLVLPGHSAVAAHRALHVELLGALAVGGRSAVAPDLLALHGGRGTVALEAVAAGLVRGVIVATGMSILEIDVLRALATLARAVLGQVALVGRVAAELSLGDQLMVKGGN